MDYENAVRNIRSELKTYVKDSNLKSLVLGVSGGIDSTLCALLAKPVCDELGIPLIGRSLPASTNSEGENSRAKEIGELFCTDFSEDDLQGIFGSVWSAVKPAGWNLKDDKEAYRMGNVKARLRMIMLYDLAQLHNGMVLSTDNYTELLLGFWTLHGDVGDYGMIQNLWKTEVYEMAEWLMENEYHYIEEQSAIRNVIEADATDGLGISKTDLDQIMPGWEGSSRDGYAVVDKTLKFFLENQVYDMPTPLDEKDPVISRYLRTQFKRDNPYNIPRELITNK